MTLHAMAQRIEHWLIEKLIPYARNPRTHSDAQVAQIASSIAEFGFNNPILVDTKAGIIAGHGRLLAARKLQLKEVPVHGEFIKSRGNRCLVQPATVLLPAMRGKAYRRPRSARIWHTAF
jgi:ParB-like nuclease domain